MNYLRCKRHDPTPFFTEPSIPALALPLHMHLIRMLLAVSEIFIPPIMEKSSGGYCLIVSIKDVSLDITEKLKRGYVVSSTVTINPRYRFKKVVYSFHECTSKALSPHL